MSKIIVNEHQSPKYQDRTAYNANSSDVTLALATDLNTRGELLTKRLAGNKYLGILLTEDSNTLVIARALFKKMKDSNAQSLNIAGNGIYTLDEYGCTQEFINQFVYEVIAQTHFFYPIKKIYTGGQTGVDMAGAIAAVKLGIPVELTFPKGYIQRYADHKDYSHTQEDIFEQLNYFVKQLHHFTPATKEQIKAMQDKKNQENGYTNQAPAPVAPAPRAPAPRAPAPRAPAPQPPAQRYPEDNYQMPVGTRRGSTFEPLDESDFKPAAKAAPAPKAPSTPQDTMPANIRSLQPRKEAPAPISIKTNDEDKPKTSIFGARKKP